MVKFGFNFKKFKNFKNVKKFNTPRIYFQHWLVTTTSITRSTHTHSNGSTSTHHSLTAGVKL